MALIHAVSNSINSPREKSLIAEVLTPQFVGSHISNYPQPKEPHLLPFLSRSLHLNGESQCTYSSSISCFKVGNNYQPQAPPGKGLTQCVGSNFREFPGDLENSRRRAWYNTIEPILQSCHFLQGN